MPDLERKQQEQGGLSATLTGKNGQPPREGFLLEGVADFLTKGGKDTPLSRKTELHLF